MQLPQRLDGGAVVGAAMRHLVEQVGEQLFPEVAADGGRDVGEVVDVVLEAVGKPSVWSDIASIVAPRARVAMTGLFAGQTCAVDFDPLVINNVSILGSLGGPGCWDEAISLHERGKVTAAPLITHRLPLARIVEGIEIMRSRSDHALKVVLTP